jgi:acyl-CoA:acyl-CoA alkyltransferase
MNWSKVCIEQMTYVVPPEVLDNRTLEAQLRPTFDSLRLGPGQLSALTGVEERRLWPAGVSMAECAAKAGLAALRASNVAPEDVGALIFGGVCRDNLEPSTACAVAEALNVGPEALIYDISNACLGVMNAMVDVANQIELGRIRAGLVVSAESSRAIIQSTVAALNANPTTEGFRYGLATMTGGSGAIAVLLTHADVSATERRLLCGTAMAAPSHHRHCRWGPAEGLLGEAPNVMSTDASAVLTHGVQLGVKTWQHFLQVSQWKPAEVDKVVSHQVGSGHRKEMLRRLAIDSDKDFSTFPSFGNTGTVSVPLTAAMADEAGFFSAGDRVALLGIGSGLNCLMLGVRW